MVPYSDGDGCDVRIRVESAHEAKAGGGAATTDIYNMTITTIQEWAVVDETIHPSTRTW